ncbi:hypothetical protein LNQ49_04725 [Flavobacterium sp. F-65]|jgi:hypothetical protein|uniref:Prepilin-type N-terminal cleavage/methylation domain-containing protein n=1 Tax=Flavobacterium pisciphilum TaxID=2893755 RepID=A0ABS8MRR1_9FLAO|nr:hypothetical protein [Flavobacterium sp. F-65]MCC9070901.1 hypothetical protein [Flavobacterium sp. F-65]
MVVLKKIKSATLIEALVATVLIVIIFVIASLVLNNLVLNTFSKNTHLIETRMNELAYEIQNKTIKIPHEENYGNWNIEVHKEIVESKAMLFIIATNDNTKKQITKQQIYDTQ